MVTLVLGLLLCGIYPLVIAVVGNLFFGNKSKGGIVYLDGKPVGAELIGQTFTNPKYFQGRISAAGEKGYDASSSSGSNLGPTSKKWFDRVKADIERIKKDNPSLTGGVPAELVTASGSGLDPHLSPLATQVQADRVAKVRGVSVEQITSLISQFTSGPDLGFFGESTVNILMLNLALDQKYPAK